MKVDITKSYDRVEWSFLHKILMSFGFSIFVINLIMQMVSTTLVVVLVNGRSTKNFKPSRWLRQGDPLSLIIFTIMTYCLGRYIGKLVLKGEIQGLQPSSHPLVCSHEQFVDDTIFLGKDDVREARNFKKALNIYSPAIGELINWNKSSLFFINTPFLRQGKIANIFGFSIESFTCNYLGFPWG